MDPKTEDLASYLLHIVAADLSYWSNENGFEFVERNRAIFEGYGVKLTYESWVSAAEKVIPQLPVKTRPRGGTNSGPAKDGQVKIDMARDVSEPFQFTITHDKEFNTHLLILEPIDSVDGKKAIIKIHCAAWESIKEVFGTRHDPVSGQTQVFKKD